MYRRSDGTQTIKRGFARERAARDARRRLIEQVERGEIRHTKETFGSYWERWLTHRRPYLEPGTWSGHEVVGRKRLLPAFGVSPLGELSVDTIRDFLAALADEVEAGDWPPKRWTTRSARSWSASTRRSRMVCLLPTRRCACSGSRPGTSSASTSGSTRFRDTSMRALAGCSFAMLGIVREAGGVKAVLQSGVVRRRVRMTG